MRLAYFWLREVPLIVMYGVDVQPQLRVLGDANTAQHGRLLGAAGRCTASPAATCAWPRRSLRWCTGTDRACPQSRLTERRSTWKHRADQTAAGRGARPQELRMDHVRACKNK